VSANPLRITYEDKVYVYDPDKITIKQAFVVKAHTGFGLIEFSKAVNDADPASLQALFWLMKQQAGEPCEVTDLDFKPIVLFSAFMAAAIEEIERLEAADAVDPTATAEAAPLTAEPTPISGNSGASTSGL